MQPKKSRKQSRRRTRAFSSGDRWAVVARNAGRSSLLKRPMLYYERGSTRKEVVLAESDLWIRGRLWDEGPTAVLTFESQRSAHLRLVAYRYRSRWLSCWPLCEISGRVIGRTKIPSPPRPTGSGQDGRSVGRDRLYLFLHRRMIAKAIYS